MIPVREIPGCQGCPLFGNGSQGYVPDELIEGAPVLILGQNPGEEEEQAGRPFVGKTGRTMETSYFKLAGLQRGQVSIGNTIRCRWQDSNELPPLATVKQDGSIVEGLAEAAIRHCDNAHGHVPSGTRLIVTQGEYALWCATDLRSVTSWRGWLVPPNSGNSSGWKGQVWSPATGQLSVLPTVHLAAIFRQPTLGLATRYDWKKVQRILKGEWPSRFPGFWTDPPEVWPKLSAFDTEYDPKTHELERYSLYDGGDKPWVIEVDDVTEIGLRDDATVVMHNIEADMDHLTRILKGGQIRAEDTMLMHAVLWSDLPHDLEFLASLFGRINRHKHLFVSNPLQYSAGDALVTWDVYLALAREMKEDPQSYWVYRNCVFPLASVIMEAERVGLQTDQERVQIALDHFEKEATRLTQEAQAYAGYPLLLSSPEQVSRWLYQVEGITPKGRGHGRRQQKKKN